MKKDISAYLQVLYDASPAAVGGKLPDDNFYYTEPSVLPQGHGGDPQLCKVSFETRKNCRTAVRQFSYIRGPRRCR